MTPDELRYLLRRPIAFHRAFADLAGSAAGGLFLSQLFYWSDKGAAPDGWIYKTQEEWQEETALTRSEQERARRALRDLGVLEEDRRGVPSRLYYRLNVERLATMLNPASYDAGIPQARMQDSTGKDVESCTLSITETTQETTAEGGTQVPPRSLFEIQRVMRAPRLGRR